MEDTILNFDFRKDSHKIIKVIGVGGGGGNAVTHMYKKGIHDVSFVLCNTDSQALKRSDVPEQLVLGRMTTQGLGAGNKPERAMKAAEESLDDIHVLLEDGTKMVFITAGMGGGTGTGAAPVIARIAKDMGILTVGIVTIPFLFEGKTKILQALHGVEEIAKNVDALLVINNERLREIYADLSVMNAFGKADDTLATAAKSIAEIITLPGIINLDFADVYTTLKEGGVALMSNGFGEGEGRVRNAVKEALNSPLLSNNNVKNARKILFNVYFSEASELRMEEMADIHDFMSGFNPDIEVIWGTAIDDTLGDKIKIMIIATGFSTASLPKAADILSEEDIRKEDDKRKNAKKEKEMMDKYYGTFVKQGCTLPRPIPVIFQSEELDDDAFIALVEDHPAYNRDNRLIAKARNKVVATEEKPAADTNSHVEEPAADNKPKIKFY